MKITTLIAAIGPTIKAFFTDQKAVSKKTKFSPFNNSVTALAKKTDKNNPNVQKIVYAINSLIKSSIFFISYK
jgi:hypothetical protein